jgi:hypothetical protein
MPAAHSVSSARWTRLLPQRRVLAALFLHNAHGSLVHFWGEIVCLEHGTVFSRNSANSKRGAIHFGTVS